MRLLQELKSSWTKQQKLKPFIWLLLEDRHLIDQKLAYNGYPNTKQSEGKLVNIRKITTKKTKKQNISKHLHKKRTTWPGNLIQIYNQ